MEFRGLMGGLYRISEWIMRFSVINVLWVILSIPFFYLTLAGLIAATESVAYIRQSIVLIAIVSPFTLFPATAAMFSVARKWVTGDVDVPLFKTYFRGYKENYLQSMLGGLFFVVLASVMYVNYTFYLRQSGALSLLSILFIVLAFILMAAVLHFFSIMVHFHMKFWQILKNSFLITIGNPVMTVFLLVANGVIVYVSLYHFTFLIPFFMGSLMAFVSFWAFYRIFDRMKTLSEKKEEEEAKSAEEAAEGDREDGDKRADKHADRGQAALPEGQPAENAKPAEQPEPGDKKNAD
ncbi:YesL family protein [Paenibacillus sp. GYB003]|uniref:YesL family protein n=1 Tax=Paenibacillus sp. GYB003 TaxID=2994392 RepID=UPI002F968D8F